MGITIHYNGKLKQEASLSDMIRDVENDIFQSPGWHMHVFNSDFDVADDESPPGLFGFIFSAKNCEPVCMTFDRDRNLHMDWIFEHHEKPEPLDPKLNQHKPEFPGAFTKTQFAGPNVHIRIVDLLRKLSIKYFEKFEMIDEAGYWENPDKDALMERFGFGERVVALLEEKLRAL